MWFAEKPSVFISTPSTFSEYREQRAIDRETYGQYKRMCEFYERGGEVAGDFKDRLFFEQEPYRHIQCSNIENLHSQVDYLISCHITYPLTGRWPPSLYLKKSLNLPDASAFSLTGRGGISPLLAMEIAYFSGKNALVVCMEQIYDRRESLRDDGLMKADAVSAFTFTFDRGEYRILACEQRRIRKSSNVKDDVQLIGNTARSIIDCFAQEQNVRQEDVLVLLPTFKHTYFPLLKPFFIHSWGREDSRYLGTADPFYTLIGVSGDKSLLRPYLVLIFVDAGHSLGVLFIKNKG
ncbi:hypothetical protein [Cohnella soli]|uniref:Uncharacterized protein n=1 Tax=Cohnella soli TaxID=425005 RepID=A0ABW0I279_9BACL